MGNFAHFTFNVLINSFLSFFTTAALVFCLLFLFRIQSPRLRSYLMAVPLIKLPFDLFRYDFSRWVYYHAVNPLDAAPGSRMLSLSVAKIESLLDLLFSFHSGIGLSLKNGMTFSIGDVFATLLHPMLLMILAVAFLSVSLWKVGYLFYEYAKFSKVLPKRNGHLAIADSATSVPFCFGLFAPKVYLSTKTFSHLSKGERRAVIAHERAHARHFDPLFRFVLLLMRALFWWVPTKWLINRIEQAQELSADRECCQIGVDPCDLASAMLKILTEKRKVRAALYFSGPFMLTRLRALKHVETMSTKRGVIRTSLAVWLVVSIGFLGRYWLF